MEFTETAPEPFGKTLLEMAIPSQLSLKTPLVFRIVKELKDHGCLPWTGSPRAELCFDEALTNAMVHGNRLDPNRKVRVRLCADDANWGLIVSDEGNGFGPEDVPNPDDPEFLLRESGRGILLMQNWLDTLKYCRPSRSLMMVRKRQTEPEDVEAAAAVEPDVAPRTSAPVSSFEQDGVQVITVNDERIQDDNIGALRNAAQEAMGQSRFIALDVSRVGYISSVGLSTLVGMYKSLKAKSGKIVIVGAQASVKEILQSAHLVKLFPMSPDLKKAIAELKTGE